MSTADAIMVVVSLTLSCFSIAAVAAVYEQRKKQWNSKNSACQLALRG